MQHRALGRAVRAGTFGALAVVVTTISLVPPAGAAGSRPASRNPDSPGICTNQVYGRTEETRAPSSIRAAGT